jgi:hypothetical protein
VETVLPKIEIPAVATIEALQTENLIVENITEKIKAEIPVTHAEVPQVSFFQRISGWV